MMDRREALLLVDRLKRRTRDPDVLTLCEYVHGTDANGQPRDFGGRMPGRRRLCPSASCPVCAARRAAETARLFIQIIPFYREIKSPAVDGMTARLDGRSK